MLLSITQVFLNIRVKLPYYDRQLLKQDFSPCLGFPILEAITEEEYLQLSKHLKPLVFNSISGEEVEVDKFCNNDVCEITPKQKGV